MLKSIILMKRHILFLFVVFSLSVFPNEIYFRHIGLVDGLPQINVLSIYQDELGAMWFGTTEGICRYTGNNVEVFRPSEIQGNLTQNAVKAITGDKAGSVYLIASDDLLIYDMEQEVFKLIMSGVNSFHYRDTTLWFLTNEKKIGLIENNKIDSITFSLLPSEITSVTSIYVDENKKIYIGTQTQGLWTIENGITQQSTIISTQQINCINKDGDHNLWVGTHDNGVYVVSNNGKVENFKHHKNENSISNNQVRSIMKDNANNIWVGTFMGLNRYSATREQKWSNYIHKDNLAYSISHSSIFPLYQDMQGNIWIGTYFGGINYFNPEADIFKFYGASTTIPGLLSFPFIGEMVEDKYNNLWICTEGGGLNCLNLQDRSIKHFLYQKNDLETVSQNNIKSIWYRKEKDLLYLGIHNGGLCVFDIKTKKARYIKSNNQNQNSLPNNTIDKVQFYNGELYLLTHKGLVKMDLETEQILSVTTNKLALDAINSCFRHTFFIDSRGLLWAAGDSLICVNLANGEYKSYNWNAKQGNSIGKFTISVIFENSKGDIFFGTLGSGLLKFQPKTDDFSRYMEADGMMSNYCYSICETPNGYLLLSHNKGISFFDPDFPQLMLYRSSPNFPLDGINLGCSSYVTTTGEIFVGGINGLVSFYESQLSNISKDYMFYFDKLYVNNKQVKVGDETNILTQALPLCEKIVLNHKQNNIRIDFANSNFIQSQSTTFEYKLMGFDKDWVKADINQIYYSNLHSGEYTLLLRETHKINRNPHLHRLDIKVIPPYYATKLAYVIYLILLILLIIGIIRFYIWRAKIETNLQFEREEKERIKDLNNSKLRFFTNISHEFRTPLTLILTQTELLLQSKDLGTKVYNRILKIFKNAGHLNSLISELLDFRKQEQGYNELRVEKIELIEFIQEIYSSFLEYSQKQNVNYKLEYAQEEIFVWIDPKQIRKVIYNLLSNAFKYTPSNGSISLFVKLEKEQVIIEVEDSGLGIPADSLSNVFERFYQVEYRISGMSLGTGIGLALAKEIVLQHKGEISVRSILNKGSVFRVALLLGDSHFSEDQKQIQNIAKSLFSDEIDTIDIEDEEPYSELEILEEILPEEETKEKYVILIVEDNDEQREMLKELFEPTFTIYTASNGKEGLDIALEILPNLILSDMMMPLMSGKELCHKIKNNINTSHIPVVLLTADTSVNHMIEGYMFGADDYVAKPFNLNVLLARCVNLIKTRRMLLQDVSNKIQEITPVNTTSKKDLQLIDRTKEIIRQNFDNPEFDMNYLAEELNISRSKLFTKIKDITGLTPNEFTLSLKLNEATILLKNNRDMNISEIAYYLGFSTPKYFTKSFKAFYGVTPQAWRDKLK